MKLFVTIVAGLLALAMLMPSWGFCSYVKLPKDDRGPSDMYVFFKVLVEGELIQLLDIPPREEPDYNDGFLFPFQEGRIEVHSVLCNKTDRSVAAGDTLVFLRRSGSIGFKPNSDGVCEYSGKTNPISTAIGSTGVFNLKHWFDEYYRMGAWFYSTGDRREDILEFFESQAADSLEIGFAKEE